MWVYLSCRSKDVNLSGELRLKGCGRRSSVPQKSNCSGRPGFGLLWDVGFGSQEDVRFEIAPLLLLRDTLGLGTRVLLPQCLRKTLRLFSYAND